MHKIKNILLITTSLFFIACGGENTQSPVIKDIQTLIIDDNNFTICSTDADNDKNKLSATICFDDASCQDATDNVTWNSTDISIASVTSGYIKVGSTNGGDVNITVSYRGLLSDPITLNIKKLTSFNISSSDINTTGDHTLEATGNFDSITDRVIAKNIIWSADNGALFTTQDDVITMTILTGDTNLTATVFQDENLSSPIAPQTKTYTVN